MLRCVSVLLAAAQEVAQTTPAPSASSGGGFPWTPFISGVVGAVLALLVRSLDLGTEVRRNNAMMREYDEALIDWTADRDMRLREDSRTAHELGSTAHEDAGIMLDRLVRERTGEDPRAERILEKQQRADRELAALRAAALRDYRTKLRETNLEITKVEASEQWPHRAYRWSRRMPTPELQAPDRVAPLLAGWRKPAMYAVKLTVPDDATRRTLDDVVRSQPVTGP